MSKQSDILRSMERSQQALMDYIIKQYGELQSQLNAITEKYELEMETTYTTLMTSYYLYETDSYIRHGQTSPGTCTGVNLYNSNQISLLEDEFYGIDLSINANNLEPYNGAFTSEEILKFILNGKRSYGKGKYISWNIVYKHNTYRTVKQVMSYIEELFTNDMDKEIEKFVIKVAERIDKYNEKRAEHLQALSDIYNNIIY